MQYQAQVVVIYGGRVDTSILYRLTKLNFANMTVNGWTLFNSGVVSLEKSGGYMYESDILLAPALGYSAHAKKIDSSDIVLRQMLPAKRSRRPLVDPGRTLLWD